MKRFKLFFLICAVLLPVVEATAATGSTPRLNLILPRGIQRGQEHLLRFTGERLSEAEEVFLYEPGIDILELIPVDANNLDVKISVSENCRLGEHVAQVRTARGISDFRSFYVGPLPEVTEVEPNNSLDQPQAVELNVTLNGVITNEDIDIYKVVGAKGQRLSVEIEAMRLGYYFDPFIAVLDDQNFEIAVSDDSFLHRQDGVISLTIPDDGDYYVLVREASYGGNGDCRYRLHVGDFARPTAVYPAGGPPKQEISVQLIGDPGGPISKAISLSAPTGSYSGFTIEVGDRITPSLMPFRVSELLNHLELEPNGDFNQVAQPQPLPTAFNGIIGQPGDHDCFRFSAQQGEAFDVECYSRRIRSGLDPVINIFNAAGQHIVGDDDARRPDCYIRFSAPETGDFFIRVRDHLSRGQQDFVYRIEITRVEPSLAISIPRIDRYSQLRQQICVPQGNRFATLISAERANFGGELELIAEGLPDGITMQTRPMVANLNLVPVVFSAASDAPITGNLMDLKAKHTDPATNIVGGFALLADFALGEPNNSLYHTFTVNRLACAVTKALPYKIDLVRPSVPLVRDGSMNLKIVATRDEGFVAPIIVEFPFRPPGTGTNPQLVIEQGATEAYYAINANADAQLGKWPIYAIGNADVEGPVWAASSLSELEISEPYVTVEMNRSSCAQGEATTIYCKLIHRQPFEGEATAELLGIPPFIEIPSLKFTKDTPELIFNVTTSDKSPIGIHKGLFCQVTITQNGEPIVSTAARGELQINPPAPVAVIADAAATTPATPAAEPAKPKSRLEQVREAANKRRGQ